MLLSYYDAYYRPVSDERGEFSDALNHDHYRATNLDFNTHSNFFGYGMYYADGVLGEGLKSLKQPPCILNIKGKLKAINLIVLQVPLTTNRKKACRA